MENAGEAYPRCPIPLLRFFAAKYVRFLCLEKLIHFMDRPYEAINGTVRPAFVFRGKIVVWNLMLMSILMANSKENISKSYYFHSFQLVDNKDNRKFSPFRFYMAN